MKVRHSTLNPELLNMIAVSGFASVVRVGKKSSDSEQADTRILAEMEVQGFNNNADIWLQFC